MITFPCKCGHLFTLPEDSAGLEVQCPDCGLLADVPKLGDVQQLLSDGTYKFETPPPKPDAAHFEELIRTFGRHKTDQHGEIDLRTVAHSPSPMPPPSEPERAAPPRYDPETGELVPLIEIKPDEWLEPEPLDIPMATRVLPYSAGPVAPAVHLPRAIVSLFHPVNLAVMFFVFLVQMAILVILTWPLPGTQILFSPVLFFGFIALNAHYVNVIVETGPDDRDELPRFLRDFDIGDDLFLPFLRSCAAWAFCYGLPFVLLQLPIAPMRFRGPIVMGLAAVGTLIFPAVLLTSAASGSIINLRPDRPWKMIGAIGPAYVLLVILYAISATTYFLGFLATLANADDLFNGIHHPHFFLYRAIVAYPLLMLGILLTHYFCWMLGLTYRSRHEQFPWVLQRHQHSPPPMGSATPMK